ncbi:PEPxxWA-CTERM sorting domain-containing protein [Sphingomonas quercus]|uniref:PEPxxWA-CTERM sorting domain-containing protein n=1 Tax=Sphingomonas quercus TaxID=2842451 RepID=A0ABS6BLX5_9SPHN|nr:PEPxxWA-CTERM sorting domain-containing protein [Sphingomonas quercus]MBU3079313.1 PEPxxWA-CTERM sorting domain-containing protein [Sphingomonas quercus]
MSITLPIAMAAALTLAAPADAATPVYPDRGVENPAVYDFNAVSDGPIYAYFMGASAGFQISLGLKVNGVEIAQGVFPINGLGPNPAIYSVSELGMARAGDTLEFFIDVVGGGDSFRLSSDASLNAGGFNHVYSAAYAYDPLVPDVPAGVFVSFEDDPNLGDRDYNDLTFVFINVATERPSPAAVPEPASWATMLLGFGVAGAGLRRCRIRPASASA